MKSAICTFLLCLTGLGLTSSAHTQSRESSATNVYVIPFSHLDLFWAGSQEETLSRGNRIIARAMQLAKAHPEYRFLLEDDDFVADFMDGHRGTPEVAEFTALVKSHRFEIAPKWAGIYQNIPRAEALLRNLVYGKRYARDTFGVDPLTLHAGDIPGFTRQYPQLMRSADIPYMVMSRMGPVDTPLFNWKSPDGTSALVWDTVKGYGWGVELGMHKDLTDPALDKIKTSVGAVQDSTRGPVYLGWGTDLFAPNELLVSNMGVLNQKLTPLHFHFATPDEYFADASKTQGIPALSGEITGSWANLNSSASPVWPPAVAAADMLVNAEKFAAISYALDYASYPQQQFNRLWKDALKSMDHNFFGQGGEAGDARKSGYAEQAILEGGQILRDSLRDIAGRVKHADTQATAIVVFNSHSWTRDDIVRAHVSVYGDVAPGSIQDYRNGMRLVDAQGNEVPFDVESYSQNVSRALTMVFPAHAVPSFGYKTYYLEPAKANAPEPASAVNMDADNPRNPFRVPGSDVAENRFYRVTIDHVTGRIELFDKTLSQIISKDVEIVAQELRGGDAISVFPSTGRTSPNLIQSVKLVRNGAEETVLQIDGRVAEQPIKQTLTLYRDIPRIDIENSIDWTPGRAMEIQQVFPTQSPCSEVRNGVPFGSVAEADMMPNARTRGSDEVPMDVWKKWRQIQDWISCSNAGSSFTISSDHQLFTVDKDALRADMLRGTGYNQLRTYQDDKPAAVKHPKAGTYVFRYSISSGKGDWTENKAWRHGMDWTDPLIPVTVEDELTPKTLPAEQSFLSVEGDSLVVSALKKADTGDGIVLRVFEESGRKVDTPVRFLGRSQNLQIVNALEESTPGHASANTLTVAPYQIETIKLAAPKQ